MKITKKMEDSLKKNEMEDNLKKNGGDLKKMKDYLKRKREDNLKKKWNMTSSTIKKSTLIGCDIIVN
jgi:hypothetical protein